MFRPFDVNYLFLFPKIIAPHIANRTAPARVNNDNKEVNNFSLFEISARSGMTNALISLTTHILSIKASVVCWFLQIYPDKGHLAKDERNVFEEAAQYWQSRARWITKVLIEDIFSIGKCNRWHQHWRIKPSKRMWSKMAFCLCD